MAPKKGTHITDINGFDFHQTNWENSGEEGDKGKRTSYDWKASNGGWVRGEGHSTDQNASKGDDNKRHPEE